MNIVILDDYQDAVRKLHCAERLDRYSAKVYTNTVKGLGQLSVRLKDADVIVLIRERTQITKQGIQIVISQGNDFHIHHRIGKATFDQHIAKIVHVGKALRMRIAVSEDCAQFLERIRPQR